MKVCLQSSLRNRHLPRQLRTPMTSNDLATARAYHEAGNLGQAEEIYRRILTGDPRHAEALHLLGLVEIQRGNPQAAVEHLRQAVAQDGSHAEYPRL